MANPKPAILVSVAFGVAAGIVMSVKPWSAYLDQRDEAAAVRQELKDARAERARLEREEAKTRTHVGRETKAREANYRNPNERDLNLDAPSNQP